MRQPERYIRLLKVLRKRIIHTGGTAGAGIVKRFTVNSSYSGRKVFIEFEGVQKYCKVWLNGKYLGDHKGGYGSFDFDITDFLIEGKENVLAVAVNNSQNDKFRIPPMMTGKFNIYGGIYRNVTLVLKDKLYIPMQGSAAHEGGTFVMTPNVSEKSGTVRVQTWVKNDYPQAKSCVLTTYIHDATGRLVKMMKLKATINAGTVYKFDQTMKPLAKPNLWSHDNPYLYSVYSEITEGKRVADGYLSPLGFRWFRWDYSDNCLYLNGKKSDIRGINRQEEFPWLGGALPEWITIMDLKNIADLKYNLLLTASYPGNKKVYDLADENGLVVIEESPGTGNQDFSAEVQAQQMKEMIRRDRNHPSILFWSMGNETDHAADSKYAVAEDTTRILTARKISNRSTDTYLKHSYDNLDIDDMQRPPAHSVSTKISENQQYSKGEPSKLVLTGSQRNIEADRASVVIVTADIVDSGGKHVDGANKTVKWSVNGPATLVGPDIFEWATGNAGKSGNYLYGEMPVSNVIRSSGKPGKITVTVSASGLTSGTLDIEAEEIVSDNSIISEPVLRDEGRKPVTRLLFGVDRISDIPREIEQTFGDINFGQADTQAYARMIREYILKNNPAVDSSTVEFRELVNLFASQLSNNNGTLVAFDYNFSVGNYNNCRLISGYINATKLPVLFKEELKKYYSDAIIRQGNDKNAGDEMNWMNWIPSGGTVVISQEKGGPTWPKGTVITSRTELTDLIATVYPVFSKYSIEAKERALTFVSKMNPHIKVETKKGIVGGNEVTSITYTAVSGKPILVPEIKFISQ